MYTIHTIHARELLDSRGNPTIEVELTLAKIQENIVSYGRGRALVPSGASTGTHEAVELRDGDKSRYGGKGVLNAVDNVNAIIHEQIVGKQFNDLYEFDNLLLQLDGTEHKSRLGANVILGCSMAFVIAMTKATDGDIALYEMLATQAGVQLPHILPIPHMNVINGGAHADNALDFQELMIIPQGAGSFGAAMQMGAEVFHALKKILQKAGYATSVGDEGGYAPNVKSNHEALEMILAAIHAAGYTTDQIKIGLDVASSEFYHDGKYCFEGDKKLASAEMVEYYLELLRTFPIVSIEDGFAEDDFAGWALCQKVFEENGYGHIRTVGDDLYVTNVQRLQMGIEQGLSNSILIKLNQIGTVSETLDCIALAHSHGIHTVISHRSGETEDTFIADLAVAVGSGFIKTGSLSRSERIAKYNQLLRIEERLGSKAQYGK